MRICVALLIAWAILATGNECLAQKYPANELPTYGEGQKTQAMIDMDAELTKEMRSKQVQASDRAVSLGWNYFLEKRDLATAMKRFNQAWLLDAENGDAYHGMAIIVLERDRDARSAERLFKMT